MNQKISTFPILILFLFFSIPSFAQDGPLPGDTKQPPSPASKTGEGPSQFYQSPPSQRNTGRYVPEQNKRDTLGFDDKGLSPRNVWAPNWWFAAKVKFFLFQSKLSMESGFYVPELTKAKVDYETNDLNLGREDDIFGGEIRFGPAHIHGRFSYMEGSYRGQGTARRDFFFHNNNILQGTAFTSEATVRDLYVDIVFRRGAFFENPLMPSGGMEISGGLGYFELIQEIKAPGKIKDERGTGFWHVGLEVFLSPVAFISFKGGFQIGYFRVHDYDTYGEFLIFRTWIGAQVNLTRFFHIGIAYRYHLYEINDEGDYTQYQLYGPSFYGAISF